MTKDDQIKLLRTALIVSVSALILTIDQSVDYDEDNEDMRKYIDPLIDEVDKDSIKNKDVMQVIKDAFELTKPF